MNCEGYQIELEDFLYGELAENRAAELRAHLAACPACAQARATLAREQEIFAQYYEQTALEPAPELWAAVRTRIQVEPRATASAAETGWLGKLLAGLLSPALLRQAALAAALVLLSVAVTTFYFRSRERDNDNKVAIAPSPTPAPTINPPPPSPILTATPRITPVRNEARPQPKPQPVINETQLIQTHIARAEREYQGALKLLDSVIARNREKFAPGLLKQYESSLALIDNSIAESRRALRARPGEAAGGQFLLAAYEKKLELMQEIAEQAGQ